MLVDPSIQKRFQRAVYLLLACLILPCGLVQPLFAQDTAVSVDQVDSNAILLCGVSVIERLYFVDQQKIERPDSLISAAYQNNTVADALAAEGKLFLKSYSLGGLTTTSWRGVGAGRTAIMWNGVNLQSPMNGVVDLSLIPMGTVDRVSLRYGGQGSLHGNGSIAGAIELKNLPEYNKGWGAGANLSAGSFGMNAQQVNLGYSNRSSSSSIKIYRHGAANNFALSQTLDGVDRSEMPKSPYTRQGALVEQHFHWRDNNKIGVVYWYQEADRQLPPTRFEVDSDARQQDISHRLAVNWGKYFDKMSVDVRAAWLDEVIEFQDPQANVDSRNQSKVLVGEALVRYNVSNDINFRVGVNERWSRGEVQNYQETQERFRTAVFAHGTWHLPPKGLIISSSIRKEFVSDVNVPLTPSAGITYSPSAKWKLHSLVARTYRIPTLNDLYWTPGGNRDLQSEDGWSAEVGAERHFKWGDRLTASVDVTGFNIQVTNLIVWLPNGNFTSPENLREVWSRGVESGMGITWKLNKAWKFGVNSNYQYVRSTNEKSNSVNDNSVGKQLIYVPEHQHNVALTVNWKNWAIQYRQRSTSFLYTASDNSEWLDGYSLGDVILNADFKQQKWNWGLRLKMLNIWGVTYEVLPARPMPLQQGEVGLYFKL